RRVPALRVRPPWEPEGARGDVEAEEIVIEPGRAFGTGSHASTQLCLELLLELATLCSGPRPVVDVGTGSGGLAIPAPPLGFAPVVGLDQDPESIDAARQNADANGVEIEVRPFELHAQTLPWLSAGGHSAGSIVVVANLLRSLLLELAGTMPAAPGDLLAGGLLVGEADEIARAFRERLGLRERARHERRGWAAVWLAAPGGAASSAGRAVGGGPQRPISGGPVSRSRRGRWRDRRGRSPRARRPRSGAANRRR